MSLYNIFDATTHAAPAHVSVNINQATGQVTLTPTSGFTGTLNLLAGVRASTATDTFANFDTQPFTLTVTPNAALKPMLGPVSNQSTSGVTPVVFNLTSTDPGGNGVVYKVADATTFGNPANATVSINQTTGQVTITPNAGFTGTITLLAGVRSSTAADTQASYDTKQFTVTVNAASTTNPTLGPISDQVTQVGTPVNFTLTSTNPGGGAVVYKIVDPTTFGTHGQCDDQYQPKHRPGDAHAHRHVHRHHQFACGGALGRGGRCSSQLHDASVQAHRQCQRAQCSDKSDCRSLEQYRPVRWQWLHLY